MRRNTLAIAILLLVIVNQICVAPTQSVSAAMKSVTPIVLTQPGQVIDSITYNGITVEALYSNEAYLNSDATYSCAAFIKKFYLAVYGVSVYNLLSSESKPMVYDNKGSFAMTEQPQVGDIIRDNARTHWAIVKSISGETLTVIQQNYKSAATAWIDCTIEKSDNRYTYFTYSNRIEDNSSTVVAEPEEVITVEPSGTETDGNEAVITEATQVEPKLSVSKKTLYTGYQDYKITLEQISENSEVTYINGNLAVAEVSSDGIITPIGIGLTTIYVQVIQNDLTYILPIDITVKEPYIKITCASKELVIGENVKLKVKQYGTKSKIIWKVSDESIAEFNQESGKLKAKKTGKVTISAVSENGLAAQITIKIKK